MPTSEPKRILVVDDEADVQDLVCRILEDTGYAVDSADDGRQALERMATRRPDLVVLDLMMPVLDGWGVLARMRDCANAPPVVVVSALAERHRAMDAGASAFLRKPFGFAELLEACSAVLRAA